MITAYDYPTAAIVDSAGVDIILVGDSLGMVVLGYETTLPVTMEEMLHHTKAVARATHRAMVVGDMPFMSYQGDPNEALKNAARFLKEAGAQAVKIEGGAEFADVVAKMSKTGIPVMGHLGLTPQSVHQLGGYKVQGRTSVAAEKILKDAQALEAAGAFALVLECIPAALAEEITAALAIPTIGIGGGAHCDGQVLVLHDMLGMFERFTPKFVKKYANIGEQMGKAVAQYVREVKEGKFPSAEHSFVK